MKHKSKTRSPRGTTARWGGKPKVSSFKYADLARQMFKSDDPVDNFGACLLFAARASTGLVSFKKYACSEEKVREFLRAMATVVTWNNSIPDLTVSEAPFTPSSLSDVPILTNALGDLADIRPSLVARVSKKLKPTSANALKAAIVQAQRVRELIRDEITEPEFRYMMALKAIVKKGEKEPAVVAAKKYGQDYKSLLFGFAGEAYKILGFWPVVFLVDVLNSTDIHKLMAVPPPQEITEETAKRILNRAVKDGILKSPSKKRKLRSLQGGQN